MQMDFTPPSTKFTFITHHWFDTKILFMLKDSLIRVSRRDEEKRILKELAPLMVERNCQQE